MMFLFVVAVLRLDDLSSRRRTATPSIDSATETRAIWGGT